MTLQIGLMQMLGAFQVPPCVLVKCPPLLHTHIFRRKYMYHPAAGEKNYEFFLKNLMVGTPALRPVRQSNSEKILPISLSPFVL